MTVLLQQDVKDLGGRGQLVDVERDYARRVLIPNNLATEPPSTESQIRAEAVRVFGDPRVAEEWLGESIPSLGNRRPIDLIRASKASQNEVLTILGRIEHGIF